MRPPFPLRTVRESWALVVMSLRSAPLTRLKHFKIPLRTGGSGSEVEIEENLRAWECGGIVPKPLKYPFAQLPSIAHYLCNTHLKPFDEPNWQASQCTPFVGDHLLFAIHRSIRFSCKETPVRRGHIRAHYRRALAFSNLSIPIFDLSRRSFNEGRTCPP